MNLYPYVCEWDQSNTHGVTGHQTYEEARAAFDSGWCFGGKATLREGNFLFGRDGFIRQLGEATLLDEVYFAENGQALN